MEIKPKERIVFDENLFYGSDGEELAVEDIMSRDGLSETEVRGEYTDSQLFEHAMDMKSFDYDEEMGQLKDFLDGTDPSDEEKNPNWGNTILVRGSVGRWDGTTSGISVYEDFEHATDCSPSRYGRDNVFADCEIQRVWDENGSLFLSGAHHDGDVDVEMRQLTDAGERLLTDCIDYEGDIVLPDDGINAMGRTYRDGDENQFVHDLWENPETCAAPRYMERNFGWPALEYSWEHEGVKSELRVSALSPDHPARKEGFAYDAKLLTDGRDCGNGRFCKSLDEAHTYCASVLRSQGTGEPKAREAIGLAAAAQENRASAGALAAEHGTSDGRGPDER